jgi:hypothetical protein
MIEWNVQFQMAVVFKPGSAEDEGTLITIDD